MSKLEIPFHFLEGEVLLFHKPYKWTSFDVVNKIRNILKQRLRISKIKIGHAGTLDPLATGLLIVCTGKATKSIPDYLEDNKEYTGSFYLGKITPSYDLETQVSKVFDITNIKELDILQTKESFLGENLQIPPMFSAKKVDGKRMYELAREGETIELQPNKIIIHEFDIEKIELPLVHFRINCSKGTYIRAIARDFGERLNAGAYLNSLCRTKIGNYKLEDAITIEQFDTLIEHFSN